MRRRSGIGSREVAGCRWQVARCCLQPSTCNLPPATCNLFTRPDDIIRIARSWLGTPYVHQASAKGAGSDCLGLIRGVWRELYGAEPELPPPYAPDWNERAWFRSARAEPLLAAARRHLAARPIGEARPGDVLVFRVVRDGPAKHCGIMTEKDRFIHAYAGRAVLESWLSRWWTERLAGVFEFPGAGIGNRES